ncbi:tetratricopeptide repeat protein [Chryseobacterium sp. Tr-659]|uniref:tetratricopeptide repeat protein n=1 Tax=Chryseobacterium sp. Tr-659 TaxID=2608340 RepID=UPI00142010CB|nr:tetratricopeptide repeat protein [Chryseobacterium sp. Tr-659]NIF04387.1 tetratricopeptide repeat protein [Chryseobacterium sp. Tr-659]
MLKKAYLIPAIALLSPLHAQEKTFKCKEIYDAVQLMDDGKYDESIALLKQCEKVDPKDHTYPYEIALAYTKKADYKNAILQLEKIKGYSNLNDRYYALLGNTYDYLNNPEQAIKIYNEGLKKFPSSGRLHLEKGVVLELQEKFKEAIVSYEDGIKAEPSFPSNYYKISKLYLNSPNILYGLMYGEIFLNLERTTSRTQEMSKLLYDNYKKAVTFNNQDSVKVDLCEAIMDISVKKIPFCIIFGKYFMLGILDQKEINLDTLSSIRRKLIAGYFKDNNAPNVLLSYHKTMEDNNIFNAYNHYIFQIGDQEAFKNWQANNKSEYDKFVEWYTTSTNILKIDKNNLYLSDQIRK